MPGAGNPGLALQDALGLLCCLCAEAAAKGLETEDPMEDESFKAVDAAVVAPLQVSVGGKVYHIDSSFASSNNSTTLQISNASSKIVKKGGKYCQSN